MSHLPDQPDPWAFLQSHTSARIARGRTGHSLPTRALLDFQLDHARARDAVYSELERDTLLTQLQVIQQPVLQLHSRAADRQQYLQRPDLGRKLDEVSLSHLDLHLHLSGLEDLTGVGVDLGGKSVHGFDLSIVIVDGLSATAINRHAGTVVSRLAEEIRAFGWSLAPLCLVEQGRVAIGDEIAHALKAETVVVLIGERPGLTSPDSMGAYLTFRPQPGLTDESRNCISNIRPEGFPYEAAVQKLLYLLTEMKTRRLSGVLLKDEFDDNLLTP
ncbi:ethanolamine ammonia-lyase subunit EutC [Larkinella punicea]|uniref:Ethanolamine ammonia-lyase small subunit n=1 Tax=Larkinella punicea TaxID=2315727 RepID=A0A368JQB9_9BACT|nr:ethanolamine ammonia-lyase subunit EutC [Larkinella punicea]RCR68371.1 ethanolamine ammonia-lyase subunit EutC [Larkinella punicea]